MFGFPLKSLMRWTAKRHGFLDPIGVLLALERFAQPSEVLTPIELLRAGVVFHARGLMNTRAIQHNLDWVWPFWVQRQFDPADPAFLPRAFAVSHVNLTHRNWTAAGLPGCNAFPIVDPRGLVTPFFDGWSLSAWILPDEGEDLLPSIAKTAEQRLVMEPDDLIVRTATGEKGLRLVTEVRTEMIKGKPVCRMDCSAAADRDAWLAIVLRPYNPEGVSFVHQIALDHARLNWSVDGVQCVEFDRPVERHVVSEYGEGDVHNRIRERPEKDHIRCHVGMATAAALYRLRRDSLLDINVRVDLSKDTESTPILPVRQRTWHDTLEPAAKIKLPDPKFQFLYEAALRTMVLMSPQDVYPGPYTYKRFWFRDAALILNGMLCAGLLERSRVAIDRFHGRQRSDGFFLSQTGEWDSNGEALWIMRRYAELAGDTPPTEWQTPVITGAKWIIHKRTTEKSDFVHGGLLPAGFSAEHLGNNDYYYWDDFWSAAGLRAAAWMCAQWNDEEHRRFFDSEADSLLRAIDRSLERSLDVRRFPGIPASPHRRMDSGAIGSAAAGYPLQLWPADDQRLLATADYLVNNCIVKGAFFQDMIHSGMNAYLTLHLAQVLMRAGDPRFFALVRGVADMASPTGQWPEAVHPHTGGGCMGDGQHVWAAAEWVMMMRNMIVREEENRLVLLGGLPLEWTSPGSVVEFERAPTTFGRVSVRAEANDKGLAVRWEGDWSGPRPAIDLRPAGFRAWIMPPAARGEIVLERAGANA